MKIHTHDFYFTTRSVEFIFLLYYFSSVFGWHLELGIYLPPFINEYFSIVTLKFILLDMCQKILSTTRQSYFWEDSEFKLSPFFPYQFLCLCHLVQGLCFYIIFWPCSCASVASMFVFMFSTS